MLNTRKQVNWLALIVLANAALGPEAADAGGTFTMYAASTAADPGWTNAPYVTGAPENATCSSSAAHNSSVGGNAETSWLYATDFTPFMLPAGQAITKVEIDVYCSYDGTGNGYVQMWLNIASLGLIRTIDSPAFISSNQTCNWRMGVTADITGLVGTWTPALIDEMVLAVHRPIPGFPTLRVKAFRIIVTTCDGTVYYSDGDHDGYGHPNIWTVACSQPPNHVTNNTDCDDANPYVHPGAPEVCNTVDDNCVNGIDEGVTTIYYSDGDHDGYGHPNIWTVACGQPPNHVTNNTDCDDANPYVHPGAPEVCNTVDDNCVNGIDEGVTTTYYRDSDGDGYGTASLSAQACNPPTGYVTNSTDCDDANPSLTCITYYLDTDGDGYGVSATSVCQCNPAGQYRAIASGDCNDVDASLNPGAIEICNNTIDEDCDGVVFQSSADEDGDGIADCTDNCPGVPNADQADADGDSIGDACGANVPVQAWQNATDGAFRDVAVDGSGNVYATGSDAQDNTVTAQYSPSGIRQWLNSYTDPHGSSSGAVVRVDSNGHVFVTQSGQGEPECGEDFTIIAYNSMGIQQWSAPDNTCAMDLVTGVTLDLAGNLYVSGTFEEFGYADMLIKYTAAGAPQWTRSIYAAGLVSRPVSDPAGNIYIAYSPSATADYVTAKLNSAGLVQWSKTFNSPGNGTDEPRAIAVDASGNVYVTGVSTGYGTSQDALTVKYDAMGHEQWSVTFNGSSNGSDVPVAITSDRDGNIVVTGASAGQDSRLESFTVKYSAAGNELWVRRYRSLAGGDAYGNRCVCDSAGNVYVNVAEQYQAWPPVSQTTIKYTPAGSGDWAVCYKGAETFQIDEASNVYTVSSGAHRLTKYGRWYATGGLVSNCDVNLSTTLLVRSGTLGMWSTGFYGTGSIQCQRGARIQVGGDVANAPTSKLADTVHIVGPGLLQINAGQQLTLAGSSGIDLHDSAGGSPGRINIDGTLLVQDSASIRNTAVTVTQAQITTTQPVHNNDITLKAGTSSGGKFYVQDEAHILDNTIWSEGDRYLDLAPDPAQPSGHLEIKRNHLNVKILSDPAFREGTLLEMRARDAHCGTATNPDCRSGVFTTSIGNQFDSDPADNWVLDTLEIGQTVTDQQTGQITEVAAKLNLMNRPGLVFQPARHLSDGRLVPETVYVRDVILHPGSVLNTGLQALYYERIWLVNDQHTRSIWNATMSLPQTFSNGAQIVDVPVLGFSLGIIKMDDTKASPFNEFDLRIRSRVDDKLADPPKCLCLGKTPGPTSETICDESKPVAPVLSLCKEGSISRITSDPAIPTGSGGVMEMRTQAVDTATGQPNREVASSVAAKGSFARAGDENITIAFDYLFMDNLDAQIIVKLSDDENVGTRNFEVARVHMPGTGRPGAIGSNTFGTFYGTFPRTTGNYTLNFTRGTYVELELRGDLDSQGNAISPVPSRIWIDNFDPQIICSGQCADLSGEGGVSSKDYLLLLAEYGQTIRQTGLAKACLDSKLSGDHYIDLSDVLAFDTLASGADTPPLNLCGPLEAGAGSRESAKGGVAAPIKRASISRTLVIAGKSTLSGEQGDALYTVGKSSGACKGIGTVAPVGGAGTRANGQLVTDSTGAIYQLHGATGLVQIGGAAVVPPRYFASVASESGSVGVQVGVSASGGQYAGFPLADAVFSRTDPTIVYVLPVLVLPQTGCPYKAAARLHLTGNGNYEVTMLYGKNPATYSTVTPDPDYGCKEYVPEPDRSSPRQIEVDNSGHVFLLSAQAASPANDWLLIYDESAGNPSEHAELLSVPSPTAMLVSSTNRLYFASSIESLSSQTRIYRYDFGCYGGSGACLSPLSAISVNNPIENARDQGYGWFAGVTSIIEDPADGRIYVTGFTAPRFAPEAFFSGSESLFTLPTLASFAASANGPIASSPITCHNLALPLSMVIGSVMPNSLADFNEDGEVNSTDFQLFKNCATRASVPYIPLPSACTMEVDDQNHIPADFDTDGDVDMDDFGQFQKEWSGASSN